MNILEFFSSDVGKVALGGLIALFAQVVVQLLVWLRESRSHSKAVRRDAEFLAIRVVLLLEDMIGNAYNVIHDPCSEDSQGYTSPTVASPPDLVLPPDGNYKAFSSQLMYRVLSLPSRLSSIKEGLSSVWNIASGPDYEEYFNYRSRELSTLGIEAIEVARELCQEYSITPPPRPQHYDPEADFRRELARHV